MRNKVSLLILLLVLSITTNSTAQSTLKKQVDSLFVIASSGELKYRDLVKPTIEELASLGSVIVPILVDKLDTKSARERLTVNNIFKAIGAGAVPYLITSLKNPNGLIVQRVCTALGDIKDSSAVDALIAIADHSRWQVRDQAIGSVGDIADNKADDAVLFAFNDEIGQVRKSAAVSSGKMKILESVQLLIHQLGDDFYGARMSAAEALLKLDSTYIAESLGDSLFSQNSFVSSLGCQILGKIKTDIAIDILYQTFHTSTGSLKLSAALALLEADSTDLCGFQDEIMSAGFDKFSSLKLKSVLQASDTESDK